MYGTDKKKKKKNTLLFFRRKKNTIIILFFSLIVFSSSSFSIFFFYTVHSIVREFFFHFNYTSSLVSILNYFPSVFNSQQFLIIFSTTSTHILPESLPQVLPPRGFLSFAALILLVFVYLFYGLASVILYSLNHNLHKSYAKSKFDTNVTV